MFVKPATPVFVGFKVRPDIRAQLKALAAMRGTTVRELMTAEIDRLIAETQPNHLRTPDASK